MAESEPLQHIIESIRQSELGAQDLSSRHVLAFFGDLPVATARWRCEASATGDGTSCAIIEELVVVEEYRHRGVAKAVLAHLLSDLDALAAAYGISLVYTRVFSSSAFLEPFLALQGFQQQPQRQEESTGDGSVLFVRPTGR